MISNHEHSSRQGSCKYALNPNKNGSLDNISFVFSKKGIFRVHKKGIFRRYKKGSKEVQKGCIIKGISSKKMSK